MGRMSRRQGWVAPGVTACLHVQNIKKHAGNGMGTSSNPPLVGGQIGDPASQFSLGWLMRNDA